MTRLLPAALLCPALALLAARADGPGDNLPDKVRPVPPAGIKLSSEEKDGLQRRVFTLARELAALRRLLAGQPLAELLPDVEVFNQAARYALENNELYSRAELKLAGQLLDEGHARARGLREDRPGWTTATGLVVRGYRSRIDGSAQPYGLVVPASYRPGGDRRHRLDVWLHGRGEKLTELSFLGQRRRDPGPFVPAGAFVLHPYGRYCNAFKFAGEIDVLEALEHVKKHYPIDEDRVVMRGFSMGGAGCWQFAVHYPDRWVAAAPGAGFSETPQFLKVFQGEDLDPPPYEKKLLRLYDCDGWAANLFNLPTVAYSGEKDKQKQAADVMAEALAKEGIDLVHVIGPGTGHSYHPRAKAEIDRRIDRLAALGRPRVPETVRFKTYTLRYNRCYRVRIDGLERHWDQATVEARQAGGGGTITVKTQNVNAFTLSFGPGEFAPYSARQPRVIINDRAHAAGRLRSDRSWSASFRKDASGKWALAAGPEPGLRKRHGLQGPIDDAFLDSFLMVRPTGKAWHEKTAAWVQGEMAHAIDHWRKQFRGDARVKDDRDVTAEDVAAHHLVLWGDPGSNAVLGKVAGKLPVGWDKTSVTVGKATFPAEHHVPVLIYPNPLNPKRYVVVNSGFTYREYDYLNNARQVPKLPDYAVLDVRTPPSSRWPGKVVLADFFDEGWRLP
jgi:pimeloyl-ACP methyl ester carboxylesterase